MLKIRLVLLIDITYATSAMLIAMKWNKIIIAVNKPIDKKVILEAARETGAILTAEEHTISGGFGSAIAEILVERCPVPMRMVGIRDTFGESGRPEELFEHFGLTARHMVKEAHVLLKMKK